MAYTSRTIQTGTVYHPDPENLLPDLEAAVYRAVQQCYKNNSLQVCMDEDVPVNVEVSIVLRYE